MATRDDPLLPLTAIQTFAKKPSGIAAWKVRSMAAELVRRREQDIRIEKERENQEMATEGKPYTPPNLIKGDKYNRLEVGDNFTFLLNGPVNWGIGDIMPFERNGFSFEFRITSVHQNSLETILISKK